MVLLSSHPSPAVRFASAPTSIAAVILAGLCLAFAGACVKSHNAPIADQVPAAAAYSSATTAGGIWVSDATLVEELKAAAARTRTSSPPIADGRLAHLAAQLGRKLGPTGLLPAAAEIEFLARRAGLFEPALGAFLLTQDEPRKVAEALLAALKQRDERRSLTHYGMAPVRSYGKSYWVVVWTARNLSLEPVPRSLVPGTPIALKGLLESGLINPRVRVARDSDVESVPAGEGPAFEVRIPTQTPGIYEVEITAEREGASSLLAIMPIYVGVEPPDVRLDSAGALQAIDVERAAIAALREARRSANLSELQVDPALTAVARDHSRAMAEGGFVGHNDSAGGTPADRVQAAGLDAALVLENVGRTRDVVQLQGEFAAHPGQRGAMLHPDVTHLGVGVVAVPGADRPIYYVTELFVGVTENVDLSTAGEVVLGHLNRARSARGSAPLKLDDALSAVAQDAAVSYFAAPHPSQQVLVDKANAELAEFSISYTRAAAVMTTVHSLAEAATLELALDPGVTHVGVAVAQGARPGGTGRSTALLITLGWGRN